MTKNINEHIKVRENWITLSNKVRQLTYDWALSNYSKFNQGIRSKEMVILNVYYGRTSEIAFKAMFGERLTNVNMQEGPDPGYDFILDGKTKINVKSLNSYAKDFVSFNDDYDTSHIYSLLVTQGFKYQFELEESLKNGSKEEWEYIGSVDRKTMDKHKFMKNGWNHPCVYKTLFKNNIE